MALITKFYLIEQIRSLLAGGSPSAGAKYEPRMIEAHLGQAINRKLKSEYFSTTLPTGETIPEGLIVASYDEIPVEKYKGLSRARLPAMPISLPRGMGVFFVGPCTSNLNLEDTTVTAEAASATEIVLTWTLVPHGTAYYVERAIDVDFEVGLTEIYLGDALTVTDTGLTTATTYYYRVTVSATGYTDSTPATANATTD